MGHREAAAADAVPMRFPEYTWPPFASAGGHSDSVAEQQAWHRYFCGVHFDVHPGLRSPGQLRAIFHTSSCFSVSLLGGRTFVND